MRVAWIVPGSIDQLTGGYLYDARIVEGLRERGHHVHVVELRQRLWPLDPAAGWGLVRALGAKTWDVAVVDELAHPAMASGMPVAKQRTSGRPIIGLVHHLRCSEPAPRPARLLASLVERSVLAGVDGVICTSRTTAASVKGLTGGDVPIEVVQPGWDTHRRDGDEPAPSRAAIGEVIPTPAAGAGDLRLLMVAHWTPRKGVVDALEALARTPPSISLDLVGDQARDPGYARRVHRALRRPELAGRVRVHGRVRSERLAELYAAADALLLASTHEGYGMVLAEAVAADLPIVATRVGAVPEVVWDGLEAELVAPGDASAMAGALMRLIDVAERRRREAHARQRATGLPTWRDAIHRFESSLSSIVARRSPSTDQDGVGAARV